MSTIVNDLNKCQMGTGKTAQKLAYIQLHKKLRPVIVVCETSLKQYWVNECKKMFTTNEIQVINGVEPVSITGSIIIIDYFIVKYHKDELIKINPQLTVFDESSKLRNVKGNHIESVIIKK